VDARDVDLALVAAALIPRDRTRFIAMLVVAHVTNYAVDVQVIAEGAGHTMFVTVMAGDAIVGDAVFVVPLPGDELLRLNLALLRVTTILDGCARWRARHRNHQEPAH
jgi:hypothetical protein